MNNKKDKKLGYSLVGIAFVLLIGVLWMGSKQSSFVEKTISMYREEQQQ